MFTVVQKLLARIGDWWSSLSILGRLAAAASAVVLFVLASGWLKEALFYPLASSYVDKIADVFDLNKHLAKALALLVAAVLGYLGWKAISFSAARRRMASIGILGLLIGYSLLLWQGTKGHIFDSEGRSIKCYVLTHDGDVTYGERPGIDAITGRQCRPVTPELADRLAEYGKGRRPQRITSTDPTFFNPRSGEPSVWYSKDHDGKIELFDLMGFHPETGEELLPVTREIVEAWKAQLNQTMALRRRPPERIRDPDTFAFFDPITGKPQAWYWRSVNGEYEFFDSPGFHPHTGEKLLVISPEALDVWRRDVEAAKKRQADEQLRRDKERREQAEREERRRQEANELDRQREADQQRKQEELSAAQERQRQAAGQCDQLAANPTDQRKPSSVAGARYDELRTHAKDAADACALAMKIYPDEQRYRYQYARALQIEEPKKALDLHKELSRNNYAASYDNIGWLLIETRKDYPKAVEYFREGVKRGDPDSMVSLADMIERNYTYEPNPDAARFALLSRAADLGHAGAQAAVEQQRIKFQQLQQQRQFDQQQRQLMLQFFGTVLHSVAH